MHAHSRKNPLAFKNKFGATKEDVTKSLLDENGELLVRICSGLSSDVEQQRWEAYTGNEVENPPSATESPLQDQYMVSSLCILDVISHSSGFKKNAAHTDNTFMEYLISLQMAADVSDGGARSVISSDARLTAVCMSMYSVFLKGGVCSIFELIVSTTSTWKTSGTKSDIGVKTPNDLILDTIIDCCTDKYVATTGFTVELNKLVGCILECLFIRTISLAREKKLDPKARSEDLDCLYILHSLRYIVQQILRLNIEKKDGCNTTKHLFSSIKSRCSLLEKNYDPRQRSQKLRSIQKNAISLKKCIDFFGSGPDRPEALIQCLTVFKGVAIKGRSFSRDEIFSQAFRVQKSFYGNVSNGELEIYGEIFIYVFAYILSKGGFVNIQQYVSLLSVLFELHRLTKNQRSTKRRRVEERLL
jgi:hypothetical protein